MAKQIIILQLLLLLVLSVAQGCGHSRPQRNVTKTNSAAYVDAVELKLKFRELADQMQG